jgi:hypothetical protein
MVDQQNTYYNWQTSGPRFPWRQLILGALVPITIFYALHRFDQPLSGALLAIGWSIGLLVIKYWRTRSVELFPALAIPIILIELIGTLITRNPDFYLASAAIDKVRARLYHEAGFDTIDKMAACDPSEMRQRLADFIKKTGFKGIPPTPGEAQNTVTMAKYLKRLVKY